MNASPSKTAETRRLFTSELEVRFERALPAHQDADGMRRAVVGLEKLSRVKQNLVLHWLEVAAQSSFELALFMSQMAPQALERLDEEGFEIWVLNGLDMKDREDVPTAKAFLRDLDDFLLRYRYNESVANFDDVIHRTYIFLQAISGEALDIRVDEKDRAWTDTNVLYLPYELAALPDAASNRKLYKVMATLLWAQTRYGTFYTDTVDEQGEAITQNALLRYGNDERALRLLAALEAVRLEGKLLKDLPGLVTEIAELRGPWPAALEPALPRLSQPEATLADTLEVLDAFLRTDVDIPPMVHATTIDPERTMRNIRAEKRTDGKPRFGAQEESFEPFPADFDDGEAVGQGQEAEEVEPGDLPSSASLGKNPTRRNDDVKLQDRHGPQLFPEPDFNYHEWDFKRGAYREDWCHLYEVPVVPGDPNYVNQVKHKYRAYIWQIRRQLEMIKGEDRIVSRQVDGEEMDIDAMIEYVIDHKNGGEPSDRLFRRRVRNERSLAVMFMVDMSGSTKGWVNNAERESLILLCEALELLNDNYAIYGFSGWGHKRCEIYPIKRFGEQYDDSVRAKIAGIEGKDFTRMGVAVRHLSKLLEEQGARHKLLVTISDGYPDDFGDEYRNDYGIEDTRRALQEAHERGIRSFCVTIDRQGADYLPRLYGPARYEVVPNAYRLPMRMAEIYRHLTT
jgi:nitric oxide reductase NorD protein